MSTELNTDASPPVPIVVPADAGPVLEAFDDTVQIKLGAEQTRGTLALALSTTPPGGGPPPHLHRDEDELFLILEGRYRFLAAGQWIEVGPGGVVYIPRGAIHTFQNIGNAPSRHWLLTTPSGFESFFGKCSAVFAAAAAQGGPPDLGRLLNISGEHGIEFVPPLGGPPAGDS